MKDPGSEAKSFERHIFKKLLALGIEDRVSTSELTDKFYTTIAWGQKSITESFTKNPERIIFSKGSGCYTFLAIPFSFFVVAPFLMLGKIVTGQGPSDRGTLFFNSIWRILCPGKLFYREYLCGHHVPTD